MEQILAEIKKLKEALPLMKMVGSIDAMAQANITIHLNEIEKKIKNKQ